VAALPAAAQCSTDPKCVEDNDGVGPAISVTPNGQTYEVDLGTTRSVAFAATLSDRNRIDAATISVTLNDSPAPNWTWEPSAIGTSGTVRGTVILSVSGTNTVTVRARDQYGNQGMGYAVMHVRIVDPERPIVLSDDVLHDEYRDTKRSQFTLSYALPAYVSMGTPRNFTLQYISELASPTVFLQVDAMANPRTVANVIAMSLKVIDDSTGTLLAPESFWAKHPTGGVQRMGAFVSVPAKATGAYMYTMVVRAHFANGTSKEQRVPARVLILNESASRYGAGWIAGGIPRIHATAAGAILHEGNGVLRWLEKLPCSSSVCTYKRPQGDFTTITHNVLTGTWKRTYSDGSMATFDGRGLMTSSTELSGRTTSLTWQNTADAAAVPVLASITDPKGKTTTLTYSAAGFLQSITDPTGRKVAVTVNGSGDLTALTGPTTLQVAYGTNHLPASFTNESGTWTPAFERGALTSITAPAVMADGVSVAPLRKYQRLELKVQPPYGYGTGLTNRAAALDRDNAVEQIVDARGHVLVTNSLTRYGRPSRSVDVSGKVTTYGWSDDGLLESQRDAAGSVTEYDWNDRGQLVVRRVNGVRDYAATYGTRTDRPDQEVVGNNTTWYSWGTRGELLRAWSGTQSDANSTTYEYDSLQRLFAINAPRGERTELGYDWTWGNVTTARSIHADGTEQTVSHTYDAAGRQQSATNAAGKRSSAIYDSRNRVREETDELGRVTKLDYTGDHLTRITDAAGKAYGFKYNALGWLESETFPDGGARGYVYDADGLLLKRTDRRGMTSRLSYDAMHRLVTKSADGVPATTYSYPDVHTVTMTNAEGSETTTMHPTSGQLRSIRMTLAGLPGRMFELEVIPDPANALSAIGSDLHFYLNGTKQRSESTRSVATSTSDGRQLVITDPRGGQTTIAYDAYGIPVKTTFPNGVVQRDAFTTDNRLVWTSFGTASANQSFGARFTYDDLYRLSTRSNMAENEQWLYSYTAVSELDMFKRMTSIPEPGCDPLMQPCTPIWRTANAGYYGYDAAGNRTDSGSVAPASNRYATFRGYALEYDLEGNLTRKSKSGFEQQLQWNAFGQLASVTTNGTAVTFGYDPAGRRVRRTSGGSSRHFLYEEDDLLLELGPDGAASRTYLHLPGTDRPLSVREQLPGGSESVHYYVLEQPGHVRGLLNASGSVVGEYAYTPFGEPIATAKGDGTAQPLRFMGRELDASARLYNVRNRWYDPELGRFISEDPIGIDGGLNTYSYVANDPMNGRDPSGLNPYQQGCCTLPPVVVECDYGYDPDCDSWWSERAKAHRAQEKAAEFMRNMERIMNEPSQFVLNPGIVHPDPVGIGSLRPAPSPLWGPNPRLTNTGTIGPRTPVLREYEAMQRRQCEFFRSWALRWTLFESLGGVVVPSGGGPRPLTSGESGTELGGSYSEHTQDMARQACAGVTGVN
jgi:RHS repeat-associated protein